MAAEPSVWINYNEFFIFPQPPPKLNKDCLAKCNLCNKSFKYSLTTKGNLLHHLETSH